MNHRLGNGYKFNGKRESNFYGAEEPGRKKIRGKFDAEEDY